MANSTQDQKTVDVAEAIQEIRKLRETPGEYGHNIVSSILRLIAKKHGFELANQIVEDLELDHYFAIGKCYPVKKALREHNRSAR